MLFKNETKTFGFVTLEHFIKNEKLFACSIKKIGLDTLYLIIDKDNDDLKEYDKTFLKAINIKSKYSQLVKVIILDSVYDEEEIRDIVYCLNENYNEVMNNIRNGKLSIYEKSKISFVLKIVSKIKSIFKRR